MRAHTHTPPAGPRGKASVSHSDAVVIGPKFTHSSEIPAKLNLAKNGRQVLSHSSPSVKLACPSTVASRSLGHGGGGRGRGDGGGDGIFGSSDPARLVSTGQLAGRRWCGKK